MGGATLAEEFIEVVNAGDTDGFLAMFTAGGYVDDWGRKFVGSAEIRRWSDVEFIGAKGQMTAVQVTSTGKTYTVVSQWTSEQHTGPSRFVLRADDGGVASLTITAA
jgi:hypothetical protein